MSDDMDYDYYYHPEDIPGNDEVSDFEEEFEDALRQYYEEEGYFE